jgi:hypothetical protein
MQQITLATFNLWNPQNIEQFISSRKHPKSIRPIPILCVTTGETFRSVNRVVEYYNISRFSLENALRNKNYVLINNHKMYFEYIKKDNNDE